VSLVKSISSQSFLDFSFLFSSNIFKKFLGFFRELVLAFFFGSSLIYASYLLIKTLTDFLSQFTFGNALQANLLPKFTRLYKENNVLNLDSVHQFSKSVILLIFSLSLLVQLIVIFFIVKKFILILVITSVVLSLVLSANFYNSLFLTIIQAKGNFKKFSVATSFNIFISTILIYPLSFFLNVFGIALSRLIGVFSLTYYYIKPILKPNNGLLVKISIKEFNFSVVFLANISLFILLTARFISGLNGSSDITYFNYSFVLLNVILTSVIFNINTILLRNISVNKDLKLLFYSLLVSSVISCLLYLIVNSYNVNIIDFIYKRGSFNQKDVISTAFFLKSLTPAYIILIFTSVIFQPFFSLGVSNITQISFKFSIFLICVLVLLAFYIFLKNIDATLACFLFINVMSLASLLISILSLLFYLRYEN
jgi:putative peptidoglycan lipid II flippase